MSRPARTLLVDGDTLIFAASTNSEYVAQFSDWQWQLWADLDEARARFDAELEAIREGTGADHVVVALSHPERFRLDVMPEYKGNRKNSRKPIVYEPMREWVEENHDCYQRKGLEGDDCLGIIATHPAAYPGEKIIAAIDKDLRTIPGLHINYAKALQSGDWEPEYISEEAADRWLYTQVLTGDSTDGYKGCPGLGPKRAEKLLDEAWADYPNIWPHIVAAYEKAGLDEDEALRQARVARILRAEDYNFEKREVRLWNPSRST